MSLEVFFALLSSIACIAFFISAFVAKRKGNEKAYGTRIISGIAMLLLTIHNVYTITNSK